MARFLGDVYANIDVKSIVRDHFVCRIWILLSKWILQRRSPSAFQRYSCKITIHFVAEVWF